jgi:DNA polymerase-3 subunit alpha
VGAFRFTGSGKKNLLWQIYMHADKKTTNKEMLIGTAPMESSLFIPQIWQSSMFSRPAKNYTLPLLAHDIVEDAYDEIEILGFPVSISQFDLLITPYRGDVLAKDFDKHLHKTIRIVGNYVAQKGVKTVKGEYMAFGTFYDCENHFFDTTNFSQSIKKYPFAGRGVYLIEGKVVDEFGFCSLEVIKMARLAPKPDPRY